MGSTTEAAHEAGSLRGEVRIFNMPEAHLTVHSCPSIRSIEIAPQCQDCARITAFCQTLWCSDGDTQSDPCVSLYKIPLQLKGFRTMKRRDRQMPIPAHWLFCFDRVAQLKSATAKFVKSNPSTWRANSTGLPVVGSFTSRPTTRIVVPSVRSLNAPKPKRKSVFPPM